MLGKGSLRYKNWQNHARELQNMPKDCKVINTGSTPSLKAFDYRLWNVQGYNLGFQPQPLYYDFETLKKYSHNISKGAKICIGIEEFKFLVDAYDDKSTDYKYYLWLDKDQIRTYDKKIGWLMKHAPAILHPEFALGDIKWIIKRVLRKKPVDFTSINTEIDDMRWADEPSALTAEERTQLYQTAIESARDAEMNEAIGILTSAMSSPASVASGQERSCKAKCFSYRRMNA